MKSTSIASTLLALVLFGAAARAQDEPPAGLLSHVKVGQRYTFSTPIGEMASEEVWHVAEVHPDRVLYLVTTRVKQGERTIMETVEADLAEWRWGGRPMLDAGALAMAKGSQSRKTLEVPGARLDCLVTLVAETEAWTAVRGDLETFPALVKVGAQGLPSRTLVKVEEGPPPTLPERAAEEQLDEGSGLPAGALDHVKVGQRWVFVSAMGELRVEIAWKVTEVNAAEGRVLYTVTTKTMMEGMPTTELEEEEEPQEWSSGGSPVMDPNTKVEGITGERKVLELGALKLECYVIRTNLEGMTTEVWTAVRGTREVFPGAVRQLVGGQGEHQLVRVEP